MGRYFADMATLGIGSSVGWFAGGGGGGANTNGNAATHGSLSKAALTNCTFRVFTVLRDPTNVTQALQTQLAVDYGSWTGSSFKNFSYQWTNTDFCQAVTVANTSGTYAISQTINYGAAKTAPYANTTGLNVYTPWGDGSGTLRFVFYVMLL